MRAFSRYSAPAHPSAIGGSVYGLVFIGIKHKWELNFWNCSICIKSDTGLADLTSVTGSLWIELESHGKVNTCPAIWWWAKNWLLCVMVILFVNMKDEKWKTIRMKWNVKKKVKKSKRIKNEKWEIKMKKRKNKKCKMKNEKWKK